MKGGGLRGHRPGGWGLRADGEPEPPSRSPTSQHQQQVLQAVERAKQVTVGELNSLIGVSPPSPRPALPWGDSPLGPRHPAGAQAEGCRAGGGGGQPAPPRPGGTAGRPRGLAPAHPSSLQQQQLQPLSHHAPPVPLTPRPAGLVGGSATGLLALSGALAAQAQLAAAAKEDRAGVEAEGPRGERAAREGTG